MTDVQYCDVCGSPRSEPVGAHLACDARRELEPPRYCTWCGRRMVVQVTPLAWSARCSRHGELRGGR